MLCLQALDIAGYTPKGASVKEHAELDLDQKAMETALGATPMDYALAKTWYTTGGNSKTAAPFRTLQGFSTGANAKMYDGAAFADGVSGALKCPGCPYKHYKQFYDYYGSFTYADDWALAALDGTTLTYGAPASVTYNFADAAGAARKEAIKKGTAYMHVWMYAIREFEDAIDDCISVPSLGLPSFPAAPSTCIPASTTLALKWNSYASEWGAYEITGCAGVNPKLTLAAGTTYTFDQSDASNWCATRPHVSELALHCLCLACSQPAVSAQPSARAAVQVPPDRLRLHRGRRAHVVQAGRGRHSG